MKYINEKVEMKFLIVATYSFDRNSMRIYARRWGIECFFKAIKSAGSNIEEAHLTDKHRLEKLFALVAIAFILGEYQNKSNPIEIKKHSRSHFSIFRYGLVSIMKALLFDYQKLKLFIQLLSCT